MSPSSSPSPAKQTTVINALSKAHRAESKKILAERVKLCAKVWDFKTDNLESFKIFCLRHYVSDKTKREALLKRMDDVINLTFGLPGMLSKVTREGADIADRELTPAEETLSEFSSSTHLTEDIRKFKIAAIIQLNFGTDNLNSPKNRIGWAERRLSGVGRVAFPAALLAEASQVRAKVDLFVTSFNLYLDKITFKDPKVTFPPNCMKVSHWGLRDYMTSLNGKPDAAAKQAAIRDLMRRVVDGELPQEIINNTHAHWDMRSNTVTVKGKVVESPPVGAKRWETFKLGFDVQRKLDPYTRYGNIIDNKFKVEREIPEAKIVGILEEVLSSPVALGVAKFIEKRLGRPIAANDVYFKNFRGSEVKPKLKYNLGKRYPNAKALTDAIPSVLEKLGFSKERSLYIGSHIRVDNSRSAGHASSPCTVHDTQLLRVRVERGGINEEEFSTYMHELGHCVEGVFSSYEVDYKSLWGVPNTAFTEAFAFTFQDKSDFVLGRPEDKSKDKLDIETLLRFWEVFEIAGPSLTEIKFFHWLYKNPKASAAQMQKKIREIGDEVWAKYYARVLGKEGFGLMSVYSHILWCDFYLADYPMGYVIAYQIRKFLRGKNLAKEMERMCTQGSIYPEDWMRGAVGQGVSVAPLLEDVGAALRRMGL